MSLADPVIMNSSALFVNLFKLKRVSKAFVMYKVNRLMFFSIFRLVDKNLMNKSD